jgi:hypothetical protein
MWTGRATMRDGSQAPAYSAQDPLAPLIEKIGKPAAEKIAGVAGKINRTGQGLWQSLLDAEAERTGNVSSISTDYDPRNEAIRHATDLASTVTMMPSVTGGAPGVVIGAGAKIPRAARGEVAQGFAPNNEQANRLLYGGTHGPDTPPGNWMIRYGDNKVTPQPTLVDLTTEGGLAHHYFSKTKSGKDIPDMQYKVSGKPPPEGQVFDIEKMQKEGAWILPGVTDASYGAKGGKLTSVGGRDFENPVRMEGGRNYSAANEHVQVPDRPDAQLLFANQKKAAHDIINDAKTVMDKGGVPYFSTVLMNKITSMDSSKQVAKSVHETIKTLKPDEALTEAINKAVLSEMGGKAHKTAGAFPGIQSPDFEKWLDNVSGPFRAKFVQALDKESVMKRGGPDIGEVRYANTDPRYRSTPTGGSGLFMGKINPELGTAPSAHSNYSTGTLANRGDTGTLGGSVPFHSLQPDLWRYLMEKGGTKFGNVPAYYTMMSLPERALKAQKVTQEVVDNVSEFIRRNPKMWSTAAAGGALSPSLFGGDKAEARQ